MATAKTPAKAAKPASKAAEPVVEYRMPIEVSDWIKQAESRISYLTTKVAELKEENTLLRKSNKIMEARVMGQSQE
jgi:hypothetical protein